MKKRGAWYVGALVLCALVALGAYLLVPADTETIYLKGETLQVALADTPALRERGLGGRESLGENEGMLFVFPKDGVYPFWMKDMRFSIDILWLAADGRIVYVVENVSPDTYPEDFAPDNLARYVLELPAGWTASHNVVVGDFVRL